MKIEVLNISLIDLSESEDCKVSLANLPSTEEFIQKIEAVLDSLIKKGVIEVKTLNITLIDLSEAEKAGVE